MKKLGHSKLNKHHFMISSHYSSVTRNVYAINQLEYIQNLMYKNHQLKPIKFRQWVQFNSYYL